MSDHPPAVAVVKGIVWAFVEAAMPSLLVSGAVWLSRWAPRMGR